MSTWLLVGIIVFVIGFILSNIVLLKKSANQKFSSSLTEANKQQQLNTQDSPDPQNTQQNQKKAPSQSDQP